jgi:hypothetical protein
MKLTKGQKLDLLHEFKTTQETVVKPWSKRRFAQRKHLSMPTLIKYFNEVEKYYHQGGEPNDV